MAQTRRSRVIRSRSRRRTRRSAASPEHSHRLVLAALQTRWTVFVRQLSRCKPRGGKRRFSEPAVHDLRVATRRLIAAIDLLLIVSSSVEVAGTREQLKRLLKSMGPLRDTQVQLLHLEKLVPEFPMPEQFRTVLLLREQTTLKRIARRLGRLQIAALRREVAAGIRSLKVLARTPQMKSAVDLALRGALASSFARVAGRRRRIDPARPATIHKMRVAFKKFRYMTEILRPDAEEKLHKAMNAYQTRMGDINDMEVLISHITSFATRGPARPPVALANVQQKLRRQRVALVRMFVRMADEFHGFYSSPT